MKTALTIALCLVLGACGGGDVCPEVTPDNVEQMTGDPPPGSPCTQQERENAPNVKNESLPL